MPGLRFSGVSFAYGRKQVLRDISLHVPAGRFTAVLGANGSGKSSLLRLAAGLRQPQAGRVELGDGTPAHAGAKRGRLGYVPQHLGLVRNSTARENACHGGLRREPAWRVLLGLPSKGLMRDVDAALDHLALGPHSDQRVRHLSGGERQRVALARLLVQGPEVVVADEPIASLDAHRSEEVLQHLRTMAGRGMTVLAAVHNIQAALRWADAIIVLRDGTATGPRPANELREEDILCAAP